MVVALDLKDFFKNVKYYCVHDVFSGLGYSLYSESPLRIPGLDGGRKANWIEYCIYQVKIIDQNH